jgi:Sensors of blue-light using FAD
MAQSDDLISLVYLSEAVGHFSRANLADLLVKSRANNSALGITGMLLYKEGKFLQVLEGKRDDVMALYRKISKDFRHRKVISLSSETIAQRQFPDWTMGFHDLGAAEALNIPGLNSFLRSNLTLGDFATEPGRAKKLLLLFKEEKLLAKRAARG